MKTTVSPVAPTPNMAAAVWLKGMRVVGLDQPEAERVLPKMDVPDGETKAT
jgi:hypothetical protein